jgi:hypothetical protein
MKKSVLVLCLVLISASAAQAQQAKAGFNGFSLTSPLEVSVGHDSNFLIERMTPEQELFFLSLPTTIQMQTPVTKPEKTNDQVLLLTMPTASIIADGRNRQFSFSWQPEFEMFRKNSDQNSFNHGLDVAFNYYLGRRLTLGVRDVYQSSRDAARTLKNVFVLLPRSRYKENAFRADLTYDVSPRTTVGVQYDNTRTRFGAIDPFQVRMLDTVGNSAGLTLSRMLSARSRLRFAYSYFTVKPLNRSAVADEVVDINRNNPAHLVNGDYRVALNAATVVEVGAGLVHAERGNTYTLRAGGDRRFGEMWFGANYTRSIALVAGNTQQVANGLTANDVYDVVTVHARGEPLRWLGVDVNVTGSRSAAGNVVDKSKSILAKARIDYRLSERVTTFVSAETYLQNRNVYVTEPLDRRRFFVGLQYSFSSEEERRINRLNRDADYVSITGRDRRRQGPFE